MRTRNDEIREAYYAWDEAHPEAWYSFVRFTFQLIRAGYKHGSAKAVVERIRWESTVNPQAFPEDFKINNNFTSFMARRFTSVYPEHGEFFFTRRQTSQDASPVCRPELTPRDFA